ARPISRASQPAVKGTQRRWFLRSGGRWPGRPLPAESVPAESVPAESVRAESVPAGAVRAAASFAAARPAAGVRSAGESATLKVLPPPAGFSSVLDICVTP